MSTSRFDVDDFGLLQRRRMDNALEEQPLPNYTWCNARRCGFAAETGGYRSQRCGQYGSSVDWLCFQQYRHDAARHYARHGYCGRSAEFGLSDVFAISLSDHIGERWFNYFSVGRYCPGLYRKHGWRARRRRLRYIAGKYGRLWCVEHRTSVVLRSW